MRDHDHLALRLGRDKQRHQLVEHGLGIEIFFRLIDDQRAIVGIVESEVEQQQHDPARARRQLANVDTVVGDLVPDRDVIGAEKPMREPFRPGPEFGLLRGRKRCVRQQVSQVSCHECSHGRLNLHRRARFPDRLERFSSGRDERAPSVKWAGLAPIKEFFLRNRAPCLNVGDPANREAELLQCA